MARESSHGSFRRVNLDGTNMGATMFIRRNTSGDSSPDCCCLNIYVNSNIQGVNNSILIGSEVKLRDPGVRIYLLGDAGLDKRRPGSSSKSSSAGWSVMFILLCISIFILLSFL